jgi:hypothetical protein
MRSPSFSSYRPGARSTRGTTRSAQGIADFLQADEKMAALLPAVTRIAALQKDCVKILPAVFDTCSVLQFDAGQLTVSTPSSALAAKLKQQLPKLQDTLLKRGWQVIAIRIKVQPGNISKKIQSEKQLVMPESAVSALATLHDTLENAPGNETLKAALSALVQRHRAGK